MPDLRFTLRSSHLQLTLAHGGIRKSLNATGSPVCHVLFTTVLAGNGLKTRLTFGQAGSLLRHGSNQNVVSDGASGGQYRSESSSRASKSYHDCPIVRPAQRLWVFSFAIVVGNLASSDHLSSGTAPPNQKHPTFLHVKHVTSTTLHMHLQLTWCAGASSGALSWLCEASEAHSSAILIPSKRTFAPQYRPEPQNIPVSIWLLFLL